MPGEALIDRACEDIADGRTVNWSLLDSQAHDEQERKQLKWLRVLEGIANLHRSVSTDESLDSGLSSVGASSMSASLEDEHNDTAARQLPLSARKTTIVDTWGRYHLRDQVGEGSFGSVYRAWDPQLEREIAIKILHQRWLDARLKDRLLREGRALAKVRHVNVVTVFAVESHEDRVGLCMEFVRGQTLEDVLQANGPFDARETALVGADVCRALAAVHDAGFVHRDVKARNVMREDGARIVLMDFGTGREVRALGEAKRPDIAGTPLYMAPEVLAGAAASTHSDVYSVGVLLYHLVTNEYPVDAHSVDELRIAHAKGERRPLTERRPDLPTRFVRVVERSLASNPDDRYPNAGEMLDALGPVLRDRRQQIKDTAIRFAKAAGAAIVIAAFLPLLLGAVNSLSYNAALERTAFATDTWRDWWIWGVRSIVAPAGLLIFGRLVLAVIEVVSSMACTMSPALARRIEALRSRVASWAHRVSLDNVRVLSSWIVLLSGTALAFLWWFLWPVLSALGPPTISKAPVEQLALLSPGSLPLHLLYRQTFSALVLLTIVAWYGVIRLSARRREPISRGLLMAGITVLGFAIASLDAPYRVLWHNKAEVAVMDGMQCYIIGERTDDMLLFCPGLPPPRNVIVRKQDGTVQRLRRFDNIFGSFSSAVGSTTPSASTHD